MASEDYKESEISKIVKRLMDEEGFEFGEAVREAMEQTKNFESKADGGAIGIEVLFKEKMKNGGRAGFFMGGPALEGQALSIYTSMKDYGATDQAIADRLSSLGLYDPNASTPDPTPDPGQGGSQSGGGGGGSPESVFGRNLDSTFTRLAGSKPKFSEDAFFGLGKFFQGKEQGTLGDRRLQAYNNPILPSFFGAIGRKFSPFNPDSRTYNPDMATQLNFLEMGQIGDETGLSLVGYDPGSGLMKYGSDSVLAGKNVTSMFGTNNYEKMLRDYITKMGANTRISAAGKAAKTLKAQRELDALMAQQAEIKAKQKQEFDKPGGTGEQVAALQLEIDKGGFDSTSSRPDRDRGSVTTASAAKSKGVGGGGYTKSDSVRESYRGRYNRGGLATMFIRRR